MLAGRGEAAPEEYFGIRVIDEATGRGVPLMELRTVNDLLFVTDSAGWVAVAEPGLMHQRVFFHVRGHGYSLPKDGFGFTGRALEVKPGGRSVIEVKRVNLAERLYRITGEGIYRDSLLLGEKVPLELPVLNAQVLGQDSAQATIYRGMIRWFWGDTQRARYPLGQFQTSGAVSDLPGRGGLTPSVGVNLRYAVDTEGFSARMAPIAESGLVWIDGLCVVPDETGRERLTAHFSRRKSLAEEVEHGLVVFNDDQNRFERLVTLPMSERWRHPQGHAVRMTEQGREYLLFASPFCRVRVPATFADVQRPESYEAYTCLASGERYWGTESALERDSKRNVSWAWRRDTAPVSQAEEQAFLRAGKLKPVETRHQVVDVETGKPVSLHAGSVNWNPYLRQWLMIAVEQGGRSYLGEIWLSAADTPVGPWRKAHRVVTHDRYTFYNPVHHAFFDEAGGRVIYFEGTYTKEFSGNPFPTPRYDYNQIMYRLDLSNPRLGLSPRPAR